MSMYAVKDTELTAIATAIRNKGGASGTITITEMPSAINAISGGGSSVVINLSAGAKTQSALADEIVTLAGLSDGLYAAVSTGLPPTLTSSLFSIAIVIVLEGVATCLGAYRFSASTSSFVWTVTSNLSVMADYTEYKVTSI